MQVAGQHYQTIWLKPGENRIVQIIDQRFLPFRFTVEDLRTLADCVCAIKDMHVRGAPLIGACAAYGMYLAACEAKEHGPSAGWLAAAAADLKAARPTAVNLAWAVDRQLEKAGAGESLHAQIELLRAGAESIRELELENSRKIGEHGYPIIEELATRKRGQPVNILTHCNAGWLACIDYGTATAPIYYAFDRGIRLHVWVDETRPRNQGSRLTAWELGEHGISHTIIADNTGGHLMQRGLVDVVIVGSDRTTCAGDVANKIGTYLKALAAKDNKVPFYAALPSSTIDWDLRSGGDIEIEERGAEEVKYVEGWSGDERKTVLVAPENSPAMNYAFDVTPARLVSGLITERGICEASEQGIIRLFPERVRA